MVGRIRPMFVLLLLIALAGSVAASGLASDVLQAKPMPLRLASLTDATGGPVSKLTETAQRLRSDFLAGAADASAGTPAAGQPPAPEVPEGAAVDLQAPAPAPAPVGSPADAPGLVPLPSLGDLAAPLGASAGSLGRSLPRADRSNLVDAAPGAGSPQAPLVSLPAVSAGPVGVGPQPAPSLGSQTVASDMTTRAGLGDAVQGWAADAFTAQGWYEQLPPQARTAVGALAALLLSGLVTAGAYVTGFRHVHRDNLLQHHTRDELLALVREKPGLHLREVSRSLQLTATNASYHLRQLERHGLVRSERVNGKRVYVPEGGPDQRAKHLALALLRRESRAAVLRAVVEAPGSNQLHLAAITGQHQGSVGWHLHRLLDAALVQEEKTPRECRYSATPLGRELVAALPVPQPVSVVLCEPVASPSMGAAAYVREPSMSAMPPLPHAMGAASLGAHLDAGVGTGVGSGLGGGVSLGASADATSLGQQLR